MNKREVKKAAYKLIVKENRTHQETFDELRKTSKIELEALAEEVAKIPTPSMYKTLQNLQYIYIGALSLVIILRIFGVIALIPMININPTILLFAVLIGIFVPILGIYGAITSRVELYRTTGILITLSVFRSFSKGQFSNEPLEYLFLMPVLVSIALAFYIPTKLKTAFSKKIVKQEENGNVVTSINYVFESNNPVANDDLLDANMK